MNNSFARLLTILTALVPAALAATVAQADPLPGRDLLKFSQDPMINTTINTTAGVVQTFGGHDELSTAYGFPNPSTGGVIPVYQGRFMADDFADNLSSPILHVTWWGSYLNDVINPNLPVNKFLISFESDVPATATTGFSHPGQPLLNQVVFRGPLAPGSGTFTEKVVRGPDPVLGESLYQYNAELHLGKDFPEKKDTVYWLKITALVDVPAGIQFDPSNPPPAATKWGWHNRDYTVKDVVASPTVAPGEFIEGAVGTTPVYHFQDDAVTGNVRVNVLAPGGLKMPDIFQQNMSPTHYLDFADGPGPNAAGVGGIGQFSKDLAFRLYTFNNVPEPATCVLVGLAMVGVAACRRRRNG